MNASNVSSLRSSSRAIALVVSGLALAFALAPLNAAPATSPTLHRLADDKALPLTATFEKVTSGEAKGTHVLSLKNESNEAITAVATIVQSVTYHANAKTRTLPEHVVAAGEVWKIADLGMGDRITVAAKGFASLELTVK